MLKGSYVLTASFKSLPDLNPTTLLALIVIDSPVAGLRPSRSARWLILKVPNPTRDTSSPLDKAFLIPAITALSDFSDSIFVSQSLASVITLISSGLDSGFFLYDVVVAF